MSRVEQPPLGPTMPVEVFTSLAGFEVDESLVPDGDDSLLAASGGEHLPLSLAVAAVYTPEVADALTRLHRKPDKRLVVLKRTLKPGAHGMDVIGMKRALTKAGYRRAHPKESTWYGPSAVAQVRKYQRAHGLTGDAVYGPRTHAKLAQYYDEYGIWLLGQAPTQSPWRDAIVNTALFEYHNRWAVHYTQGPWRMYGVRHHWFPPKVTPYEDCSSLATLVYAVGTGWKLDPNGLGFNGLGFTGTLASHGWRVQKAKPGSLCFWGPRPTFSHVAIAISATHVISHGSEIGPLLLPINYRGQPVEIRDYINDSQVRDLVAA